MKLASYFGVVVGLMMFAMWIFVLIFVVLLVLALASVYAVARRSKSGGEYVHQSFLRN